MRRVSIATAAVCLVGLVGAAPAAAHPQHGRRLPDRIDLPNGFQPEGTTTGRGTTIYAGSLANGAIWSADVVKGAGRVIIPGAPGRVSVGMDYDFRNDRLWVAGGPGPTSTVRVFDPKRRTLRKTYTVADAGFLNDVAVTRHAVYVTDSMRKHLVVIPLGRHGALPARDKVRMLPLTGDFQLVAGFNANGIVQIRSGRALVIVNTATSTLFRVNPRTGATRAIKLRGGTLDGGDGLELRGRTLYVVRGAPNAVVPVRLDRDLLGGQVKAAITANPALDVPTTATFAAGRLWVVNARFRPPPPDPNFEYWITRLNPR